MGLGWLGVLAVIFSNVLGFSMKKLIEHRESIQSAKSREHLYSVMHNIAAQERFNFRAEFGYQHNADTARMQGKHGIAELFTLANKKARTFL